MELEILTLPAPFISGSFIKIKINLTFYFDTSFWCLKRFYEGLKTLCPGLGREELMDQMILATNFK